MTNLGSVAIEETLRSERAPEVLRAPATPKEKCQPRRKTTHKAPNDIELSQQNMRKDSRVMHDAAKL
jgi:hypothetical protein